MPSTLLRQLAEAEQRAVTGAEGAGTVWADREVAAAAATLLVPPQGEHVSAFPPSCPAGHAVGRVRGAGATHLSIAMPCTDRHHSLTASTTAANDVCAVQA
jgi:hypothetical protein